MNAKCTISEETIGENSCDLSSIFFSINPWFVSYSPPNSCLSNVTLCYQPIPGCPVEPELWLFCVVSSPGEVSI